MSNKKISEFKIGEVVVYPKHGVGEIIKIESMEVSSIKTKFYVVKMEQAKLTIRVPLDKQDEVGLRKISSKKFIEQVYDTLKLRPKIRRIMWSRRAQEYDAKIFSGDPVKIAEVVRDLFRKNSQAEQSYSERQMFQVAIERLAREIAAVEKTDYFQSTEKIETILKNK
ncbi:MAG: RNA polymerase-binding transcription factor CarD [Alphaproteobacteria bacterium MarineAlpha5_Bin5]|nr:MAG: RNA polymerase-binding transcription factor CarD [Alphaproteobacteria bacterium MarineAlpha5_Bin4]PPR50155.1 MAG: RNA polymerase-binding transcription factor CarD [Alphaproteobacteria bacterium MarineAlpha5_Bin5]|tara:strand:- start:237 stop:740 length:504 start_codon:yes stop_codon:yes gene_type:complete